MEGVLVTARKDGASIATTVVTDEQGETTRPGIFASGDVVNGAKTVVEAVRYSKMVADAMDEYMKNSLEK